MKRPVLIFLFSLTIILAFALMSVGGLMDLTKTDRFLMVSKEHAWFDGLFMLGFSIIFLLLILH